MTELIYLKDSYVREFEAEVIDLRDNSAVLDRTAFYPGGGGQPHDTGFLKLGGRAIKVLRTLKSNSDVLHEVEDVNIPIGSKVLGIIDWDTRYAYMRHHTAIHIIGAIVWKRFQAISTGSQIYRDRARVDFDLERLTPEMVRQIEDEANRIVKDNRRVSIKFLSRQEALKWPDLFRTRPGAELAHELDVVRVVEIEGFDAQADGGTHVAYTGEVRAIRIVKTISKGKRNKRFEVVLKDYSGEM